MLIIIDNDYTNPIEVTSFIKDNLTPDVEPISIDDIFDLVNMKIGESVYINISEIKRIS